MFVRRNRRVTGPVLAVTLGVGMTVALLGGLPAGQPTASADPEGQDQRAADGKLNLVLDSSGSMKEPAEGGTTKIAAAKKALNQVIDGLPAQAPVGLRVYGAKVFSKDDPGACQDTQQVVPVGPADKPALKRAVDRYRPYGETPIAHSLKQAAKDLGDQGKRTIVLVSDGEETCVPDPCGVAREIAGQGIDLRIDVVGLKVSAKARRQLQCIADAGGGEYYDAGSADDLTRRLDTLSTRAYRPFEISGTPTTVGAQPGKGATIRAGAGPWTTELEPNVVRYLTVDKAPGSSLWISAVSRPPAGDEILGLSFKVLGPGDCDAGGYFRQLNNKEANHPLIAPYSLVDPSVPEARDCVAASRIELAVSAEDQSDAPEPWDVELRVDEEPPVPDQAGLPAPDTAAARPAYESTWQGSEDAAPVEGGTSFSDAREITPGAYRSSIVPGEWQLFKVKAEFGQRLQAAMYVPPAGPSLSRMLPEDGLGIRADFNGPGRSKVTYNEDTTIGYFNRYDPNLDDVHNAVLFSADTPQIRYRNRSLVDDDREGAEYVSGASRDGDYYLLIGATRVPGNPTYEIPYQFDLRVEGTPSGRPDYAELPEPAPTDQGGTGSDGGSSRSPKESGGGEDDSASSETDAEGLSPVALIGGLGGLAILLAGGGLLVLLTRKRRT